jgi:hypothetical protein
LRESPDVPSDPFSEILKLTKAESLVTGGFTAGGAWALRFPVPRSVKFFAVVKGHCFARIDGQRTWLRFDAGDVGLLSARRAFVIASDPHVKPVDAMALFSGARRHTARLGDGRDFSYLGGHVLLDPASGDLLADVLPPWIRVAAASPQATVFRWLLAQLVEEHATAMPGVSQWFHSFATSDRCRRGTGRSDWR